MCAIAGILRRDGRPLDQSALEAMGVAMAHRGPDGSGRLIKRYEHLSIGLIHRRLAIRDLSEAGHQPISTSNGEITVVFNGEIYNDRAIARELYAKTGFVQRGHCDTEILPPAFRLWGRRMFDRLRGMFAIAVWDEEQQELTLARDHLGIKPLFYSDDGVTVRFASELKGLLADPAQPRNLDHEQLHTYLAQGYPDPNCSIIASVRQVPPGSVVVIGQRGARTERWFAARRSPHIRKSVEAIEAFAALWPAVLEEHRLSDVPLAVLQSGGIDSSLITAGLSADSPPTLVTARFTSRDYDESNLAAAVAAYSGAEHHIVTVSEDREAEELFRMIAWHVDGQLADSSAYALLQVVSAAREHCTVALTGDGGDELFAGYPTILATRLSRFARQLAPVAFTRRLVRFCQERSAWHDGRLSGWEVLGRFASGLSQPCPHSQWRRVLMATEAQSLYGPELQAVLRQNPLQAYDAAFFQAEGSWPDRALVADQMHYLPGDLLAKSDLMSMAVGLEIRVPFLDRRLVEFASGLDMRLLQPFGRRGKRLLRQAGAAFGLPETVLRARKHGFNVPLRRLLRGPLLPLMRRYLIDQADALEGLFQPQQLRLLVEEHAQRLRDHGYLLWALLIFALWYQEYLRGSTPRTSLSMVSAEAASIGGH